MVACNAMNTPSHLVLNLAVLGRDRGVRLGWCIAIGAVLPDVPLFGFYLYERLWIGAPEQTIWGELYFRPAWQAVFDIVHSIPLVLLGLIVALWLRRPGMALLCASMLLHAVCDLPLHTVDAHRHFYPLSDYRFVSPVSYWDPLAHGAAAALGELIVVMAASVLLARRTTSRAARGALLGLNALTACGYVFFYWARQ